MRSIFAAALLWLAVAPAHREATVIPWAWERREDLRFVGEGESVAWYAGIITLDGERVLVEPRRNSLRLAKERSGWPERQLRRFLWSGGRFGRRHLALHPGPEAGPAPQETFEMNVCSV